MKKTKRIAALCMATVMTLSVAQAALAAEYVVQKGDYLSKIAPRYNTTWRNLAEMNNLKNPNLIYPNQVLQVPDVASAVAETPAPAVQEPVEVATPEVPEVAAPEAETEEGVLLTGLSVGDITLTGNDITPTFSPDVTEYTMNVQTDIYGVKVTPTAVEGATVTVNGEEMEGSSVVVPLNDTYEYYGIDYSEEIEIVVTLEDETVAYTVTVIRENGADKYALFEEKVYKDAETGVELPYLIYVPSNYDESKEYPVVFALHGSGQRTQSTDMVLKRYEMATVWAADSENGINECIVLAPHCKTDDDNMNWTTLISYRSGLAPNAFAMSEYSVAAYNLLEDVLEEYSTDADRVYMTGLSAGGFATFAIAIAHPDTFAALVPVCGGADPELVGALDGIPMWIFHAEDDPTVGAEEYLYPTLEALDAAGIEYIDTIYDEGAVFNPSAHFSWVAAYADTGMRNWLFRQSK